MNYFQQVFRDSRPPAWVSERAGKSHNIWQENPIQDAGAEETLLPPAPSVGATVETKRKPESIHARSASTDQLFFSEAPAANAGAAPVSAGFHNTVANVESATIPEAFSRERSTFADNRSMERELEKRHEAPEVSLEPTGHDRGTEHSLSNVDQTVKSSELFGAKSRQEQKRVSVFEPSLAPTVTPAPDAPASNLQKFARIDRHRNIRTQEKPSSPPPIVDASKNDRKSTGDLPEYDPRLLNFARETNRSSEPTTSPTSSAPYVRIGQVEVIVESSHRPIPGRPASDPKTIPWYLRTL